MDVFEMMKIPLSKGKFAIVDDVDFELVNRYKWHTKDTKTGKRWYANRSVWGPPRKNILLHRFLLNPKPDEQCDHINGDGLDNRRSNLRIATNSQNNMNRQKQSGKYSSHFKGVTWHKLGNKWMAQIHFNNKILYLGLFLNEIDAAKAYNLAASKYFGEYANLNQFKEK